MRKTRRRCQAYELTNKLTKHIRKIWTDTKLVVKTFTLSNRAFRAKVYPMNEYYTADFTFNTKLNTFMHEPICCPSWAHTGDLESDIVSKAQSLEQRGNDGTSQPVSRGNC